MKSGKVAQFSLGQFFVHLIACVLAILLIAPPPQQALGLTDTTLDELYAYGVYYYNPSGGSSDNCSPNGPAANGQNYAGVNVFSEADLAAIKANRPFYEEAAQPYGFDWRLLAVIHYRETSLRRYNPSNGQGVYQLYGHGIIFPPANSISDAEFLRQTKLTAGFIHDSYGKGLDLTTPEGIKRMFFRYNGTAQKYIDKAVAMGFSQEEAQNGEGSPYVMNMFDERRDPTSPNMDPRWSGMYVADGVYDSSATSKRPGAYTQYAAIAGICGSNSLNEVALQLAWPETGHGCNAKPEYKTAMAEVGTGDVGGGIPVPGCSCDRFVATVIRYAKADPNVEIGNTNKQLVYFRQHPELYQEIPNEHNTSNMQPGDIMVLNGHIMMYVKRDDGTEGIASASIGSRTGEFNPGVYFSDWRGDYNIFRFTGKTPANET